MFFAAFEEIEYEEGEKFSDFSRKFTFGFKLLFWLSLGFFVYNQISLQGMLFANIPSATFEYHEYWRLFTAPFTSLEGMYGLFSVCVSFWWFASLLPQFVRKRIFRKDNIPLFIYSLNFSFRICSCS